MNLDLHGKVALVTGASRGIGKGCAEELILEGVNVSICARGKEALEQTGEELRQHGPQVVTTQADVSKIDDVQKVVSETIKVFGQIDILINNTGANLSQLGEKTTDREWQETLDVNLLSAVRFTRAVAPLMRKQRTGRIINIASVSGHTVDGCEDLRGLSAYHAAKAAMIAFSKTTSMNLAEDNILVNCVCPALIHTQAWESTADKMIPTIGKTREEVFRNIANKYLSIKRLGRIDEISGLVAFLASNRASFITGAAFDVDGGFTKSMF